MARYRPVVPLLLLLACAAPLAAQDAEPAWRVGGALNGSVGGFHTGQPNCGSLGALVAGGELTVRHGPFLAAGLVEAVGTMGACTGLLYLVTRNDSTFGNVGGTWVRSPRAGVRLGGTLPVRQVSLLATLGVGWLRVDPMVHGEGARHEPWGSAALELRLWRGLALRAEHGRYRGLEALRLERVGETQYGPRGPLFTRSRWEPFTLLSAVLRADGLRLGR